MGKEAARSRVFRERARVGWVDTDASGRIHYTAAFRLFERAEVGLFRQMGVLHELYGLIPRASAQATFLRPLCFDDEVEVEARLSRTGRSSLALTYLITKDGVPHVTGSVVAVLVGEDGKPRPLPPALREEGLGTGKIQLAVGAVAVRRGRLLMVRRGREPGKGLWSLPGGRVRPWEAPEAALRREVLEECGVDVEVGSLLGWSSREGDGGAFLILDYEVMALGERVTAGDDADEVAWIPLEEVESLNLTPGLPEFLRTHGVLSGRPHALG